MKKYTETLNADKFYHIFNRGINSESIFLNYNNHFYFLQKFYQYIKPIAEIHAYCLMKNHFHFLIKINNETEIRNIFNEEKYQLKSIEFIISKQFSNLFNSYSQAFNKMYSRTGGLFEESFRRIEITSDEYLTEIITYIHLNPLKHKLNIDYKTYQYSSYSKILTTDNNINFQKVIEWFGNKNDFINVHSSKEIKYL